MEAVDCPVQLQCYHCGDDCDANIIHVEEKAFCCRGCRTVYQILKDNKLTAYYDLEATPGFRQSVDLHKFAYLDNDQIVQKLVNYSSSNLQKVTLNIPGIHCSSCIWLLEHLGRLNKGVLASWVNFSNKELAVDYNPGQISLRELVELLASIGYQPNISLEERKEKSQRQRSRSLSLKIGVAGFCFGNIMLLSFPEYLGLDFGEDKILAQWFSWIILLLSLPVLFYCAGGYFRSAFKGLKQKYLNIDVPIVLGVSALFGRSVYEIITQIGPGYLDSMAGLMFFLLVGKWFQNRTYQNLSFDRDYKSYFPLAVTTLKGGEDQSVLVAELVVDDIVLIHHKELIPADSILLDADALIDYSFVSGESQAIPKQQGEYIYAGGRNMGGNARYQVVKPVSQSYLTQLWNHKAFEKPKNDKRNHLLNVLSKYFTIVILAIAFLATGYWWLVDSSQALFVFTAVLIVACPCALSMATPFTLGNTMRILGLNKLYVKNAQVVEDLASIDTVIFDKTGTLTHPEGTVIFEGQTLLPAQASWIAALASQSYHPISQHIQTHLNHQVPRNTIPEVADYCEQVGQGICGRIDGHMLKLGSANFIGLSKKVPAGTYISIDDQVVGRFELLNQYRPGLKSLFGRLKNRYALWLLSGDGDKERKNLSKLFPSVDALFFKQSPLDKLEFIKEKQLNGSKIMMLGDGLNDAGALQQSDTGIAVTDSTNYFSPASDGILQASALPRLMDLLKLVRGAQSIIFLGFSLSFLYNIVGLAFAVSGNLTPLTAAILMPLSSISVVLFSTLSVNLFAKRLKLR